MYWPTVGGQGHNDLNYTQGAGVQNWAKVDYVICAHSLSYNANNPVFSVLLSTLAAQFPGACGLKFRNPETRAWRGVRLADGRLFPPADTGWANNIFVCVLPKGGECENCSFLIKKL